jgi:glycosyltransferase involved in cell wall biosynthesis
MGARLRILVTMYACTPAEYGGLNWQWLQRLASEHDVWVITRTSDREYIEQQLDHDHEMTSISWIYYDLPRWTRFGRRQSLRTYIHDYLWQIGAYQIARRLHRKVQFNLAHHALSVCFWVPSLLPMLKIPFIWGPVSGGNGGPRRFYRSLGLKRRVIYQLKYQVRRLTRLDPLVRWNARRGMCGLATTARTAAIMQQIGAEKINLLPQMALSRAQHAVLDAMRPRKNKTVRFLSLAHWKPEQGLHLGLEAFAKLKEQHPFCEYRVVGSGPEYKRLAQMVEQLDLGDSVQLLSGLSQREILSQIAECDVLLHPSLYDPTGKTCATAMAAGMPVICFDIDAPATQVSDETGYKISVTNPEQGVNDLANAMYELAEDRDLRYTLGLAAQEQIADYFERHYSGETIRRVYDEVLARKSA